MNSQKNSTIFTFVREHIDIVDVVGKYVSLKPAGSYLKGLSPFKSEKTPSFTVSPQRKIFYCFSTQQGGDVVDFVSKTENCSQLEAAKTLITQYSLQVPDELLKSAIQKQDPNTAHSSELYFKACDTFSSWCSQQLAHSNALQTYLTNRNISNATWMSFSVGYCPHSSEIQSFLKYAESKGILQTDLQNAHIIGQRKQSRTIFFLFENRLIFPLYDTLGRCCGFSGRIWQSHDTRPKYYNSQDRQEFSKKKLLYGLSKTRAYIKSSKSIYLTEGFFDVMALWQSGYKNTVATMGTACTQEHLEIIERHTQNLNVLYDADEAGKNALIKLIKLCWDTNLTLSVVSLPLNEDPASLIMKKQDIKTYIESSTDSINYFINAFSSDFSSLSLKEKMYNIKELIACIKNVNNPIKQNLIINDIAKKINIPKETLHKEVLLNHDDQNIPTQQKNSQEKPVQKKKWLLDACALYIIESEHRSTPFMEATLKLVRFHNNPQINTIIDSYTKYLCEQQKNKNYIEFLDTLEEGLRKVLAPYIIKSVQLGEAQSTFIAALKRNIWKYAVIYVKSLAHEKSHISELKSIWGLLDTIKKEMSGVGYVSKK